MDNKPTEKGEWVSVETESPSGNAPGWYTVIADNLYNKDIECEAWWTGTMWAIRDLCKVNSWKRERPYPLSNYQKQLASLTPK